MEREIERLPRPDRDRVIAAIQSLADTPRPHGIKQLGPSIYRLRAGNYRVIYQVLDDERLVLIGRTGRLPLLQMSHLHPRMGGRRAQHAHAGSWPTTGWN